MWTPIPGRFKDFIAMPKSTMYQSLHTTVVVPGRTPEIQPHHGNAQTAEWNCCPLLAEGTKGDSEFDKSEPGCQLLDGNMNYGMPGSSWKTQIDLFDDAVFVFSPKGDVLELPAGSVP